MRDKYREALRVLMNREGESQERWDELINELWGLLD